MKGLTIEQVREANPGDSKGRTFECWKGVSGLQLTVCERNEKTIGGNHYHTGSDPAKNPERFILQSGEALFMACNGLELEEHRLVPWTEVNISPSIVHALIFTQKSVILEYRCSVFDKGNPDGFPSERYRDYLLTREDRFSEEVLSNYFSRVALRIGQRNSIKW